MILEFIPIRRLLPPAHLPGWRPWAVSTVAAGFCHPAARAGGPRNSVVSNRTMNGSASAHGGVSVRGSVAMRIAHCEIEMYLFVHHAEKREGGGKDENMGRAQQAQEQNG